MAEENIDEAAQAVRRPPSSVLSEQAILAGLMIDNSALDSVVDIIRPEDFYRRDHRIIFEEIVQLLQEGHPADYLTVFESLKSKGIENDAGGLPYLPRPRISADMRKSCMTSRYCASSLP